MYHTQDGYDTQLLQTRWSGFDVTVRQAETAEG